LSKEHPDLKSPPLLPLRPQLRVVVGLAVGDPQPLPRPRQQPQEGVDLEEGVLQQLLLLQLRQTVAEDSVEVVIDRGDMVVVVVVDIPVMVVATEGVMDIDHSLGVEDSDLLGAAVAGVGKDRS